MTTKRLWKDRWPRSAYRLDWRGESLRRDSGCRRNNRRNHRAFMEGSSPGAVAIMVHSGSLGFGHAVGSAFHDRAKALHPKGLALPKHGFHVLPTAGPNSVLAFEYLDAMRSAANFAFANRMFLGLMVVRALSEVLGRKVETQLVHDVPHNLIWASPDENVFLHRKGACPAPGPEPERENSPFRYTGYPVIVPGSMGSASFLLAGEGNRELLESASHGAGRILSRGRSAGVGEEEYRSTMEPLRVVTAIDRNALSVRRRRDILAKLDQSLREEAPFVYKKIEPVIETLGQARVAQKVAKLWPLITIKG